MSERSAYLNFHQQRGAAAPASHSLFRVPLRGSPWLSVFQLLSLLLFASAVILLNGCVTAFDRSRVTLEAMHEQGNYAAAARMLDDPAVRDDYGERNKLLYWLDRGAVALAQRDDAKAIELLEKAESAMEVEREPTGGEQLSRWLLNDTVVSYYGQP